MCFRSSAPGMLALAIASFATGCLSSSSGGEQALTRMTLVQYDGLLSEGFISVFSDGAVVISDSRGDYSGSMPAPEAVEWMEGVEREIPDISCSDNYTRSHVATITIHLDWADGCHLWCSDAVGWGDLDLSAIRDAIVQRVEALELLEGARPTTNPRLRGHGDEHWR